MKAPYKNIFEMLLSVWCSGGYFSVYPHVWPHLTNVGYSSAFTRQTICNMMVAPIRPRQARVTFNQCSSKKKQKDGWREDAAYVS